ncbi:citrate synthase family protein [Oceanibacterium hippocampi]|uniref:citrate synthase (unknown stereospecificity) n=1 Tax=Oceanibacterium hippocampi TaxID=745714 RepID=A0A1Y5T6P0_9PROT|nr:citrate synthase family protein [Oceanibacterium hippocampi]SLN55149.1 Citrate synthase 2 [Oceanibacterium hippocampi]
MASETAIAGKSYLTAREAATELGVSRATLYAYVSRGMIRSEPAANSREKLYLATDVRALRARKSPRSAADVGAEALKFGPPVIRSSISLIEGGRLYYRGRDVAALAESASLESVAGLLWRTEARDPFALPAPALPILGGMASPGPARAQQLLAAVAAEDDRAFNLTAGGVAECGARIARTLAAAFAGTDRTDVMALHLQLARAWGIDDSGGRELIRAALVLVADHELNASAFTARCVASTGATPYAAVTAGLAALQGPRHGGQTAQVGALLGEVSDDVRGALLARIRRGETLPGFGHPLYPEGDPRAAKLIAMMRMRRPTFPTIAAGDEIATTVSELLDRRPNIDFALALMARELALPPGAGFAIFALGRSIGWIAHAQEQYDSGEMIRPRALYVGESPRHSGPADD